MKMPQDCTNKEKVGGFYTFFLISCKSWDIMKLGVQWKPRQTRHWIYSIFFFWVFANSSLSNTKQETWEDRTLNQPHFVQKNKII